MNFPKLIKIIAILFLTSWHTDLYSASSGDTSFVKEREELERSYLTFHEIVWNYRNIPDSIISNFIREIKDQILLHNKREYLFFIEELGRICDGGLGEELSSAFIEIYERKTTFVFHYMFLTFPQSNYLADLLFLSLNYKIELSQNPKEELRKISKYFKESLRPYQKFKYQTQRLTARLKVFEQSAVKSF